MAQNQQKPKSGTSKGAPKATVDTAASGSATDERSTASKAAEPSTPNEQGESARQTAANATKAVSSWFEGVFPGHGNAALFACVGLLAAILFFAIGFWQTLLVIILVVAGIAFGQYLDGDPKIINWFKGLSSGGNKTNRR